MKHLTIIFLSIFSISCCEKPSESKKLYEEYIDAYYHAYKKTFFEVDIHEPIFSIGDTIRFCEDSWLAPIDKEEFTVEETINALQHSKWIIYDTIERSLFLRSIDNSNIQGIAVKEILDFNLCTWNLAHKKWLFYEKLRKNLKLYFDSIAIRNNLSEQELMQKLAEEKYKRTGWPYFSFE